MLHDIKRVIVLFAKILLGKLFCINRIKFFDLIELLQIVQLSNIFETVALLLSFV